MKKYVSILWMLLVVGAHAATPEQLQKEYEVQSGPASVSRGEALFTSTHGKEWRCISCHENPPNKLTKHAVTGKAIEPLAPRVNVQRFTDSAKVEKWFRRNCKDVVGRECTAQEKADVIAWLLTVK